MRRSADHYENTDNKVAADLSKLDRRNRGAAPSGADEPAGHAPATPVATADASPRTAPADFHPAVREPGGGGDARPQTPVEDRVTAGDPVDVATGEMVLEQTDVVLPGLLPVVVERAYVSSNRAGRFFGLGWFSTLGQHLPPEPHPTPGSPAPTPTTPPET